MMLFKGYTQNRLRNDKNADRAGLPCPLRSGLFHCACHDASDDVFLQNQIDNDDRSDGER